MQKDNKRVMFSLQYNNNDSGIEVAIRCFKPNSFRHNKPC